MHLVSAEKKMALEPENVPKDTVYAVFVSPLPLLSSSVSMYPEAHELFSPTLFSFEQLIFLKPLKFRET